MSHVFLIPELLSYTSTYFTTPSSTYTNEISKKKTRCNHINLKTYFDKGRTALYVQIETYICKPEKKKKKKWTGNYMCGRNVNVRRSELMSFDEYYYVRLRVWLRLIYWTYYSWIDVSHSHIVRVIVLGVFMLYSLFFDDCYELWNQIISLVRRFLLCIYGLVPYIYFEAIFFITFVQSSVSLLCVAEHSEELLWPGNDKDEDGKKTKRRCWWWWE